MTVRECVCVKERGSVRKRDGACIYLRERERESKVLAINFAPALFSSAVERGCNNKMPLRYKTLNICSTLVN